MYMAGLDPTEVSTTPTHALGEIVFVATSASTPAGIKGYIYVKDSGAGITGDSYVCDIDGSAFTAIMSTTTTTAPGTGQGKSVGVARAAVAAGSYCWLQIYGAGTVRVSASCAAYTNINSTATSGQLDDDATASSEVIEGIVLDVAAGGAAASVAGWINWPRVGRTL